MKDLPEWARDVVPVDMNTAAMLLGVSRRFLVDAIKEFPHYERRGMKKVFYPEHITALRSEISAKSARPTVVQGRMMPLRPPEEAFERALRLATAKPKAKRGSKNHK